VDGEPVVLNFNKVKVSDTIDFIVETSGKTVIPSGTSLSLTVTVVNDVPLPRDEALNRLFIAFLDYQIGVVETADLIKISSVTEIATSDCPVIGSDESVMHRRDEGVIINKVFQLKYADAESVADVLGESLPDWAQVEVETGSNSVVALCSIGLAKKLESLIGELDRERVGEVRVFRLKYADAATVAEWIMEFFGPDENTRSSGSNRSNDPRNFRPPTPGGGATGAGDAPIGGVVGLRATADPINNLVSVRAESTLLNQIEAMIKDYWDRPIPDPDHIIRTYHLQYRDVLKVRDILSQLGGGGGTTSGGGAQAGTRVAAIQAAGGQGTSGSGGMGWLSNFQFQADESNNELLAISKTAESFEFLDQLIADLDRPNPGERSTYIELKHADAGEVAEQINTIFAKPGLRFQTSVQEEGLQEFDPAATFSEDTGTGTTQANQAAGGASPYPWQNDRADPNVAPESTLIGKVRVMPIYRQNALLIVGAPHYKSEIVDLIAQLDKPGRQVLISAIIAEVQSNDGLSLGLRWGRNNLGGPAENQLGGSATLTGQEENILSSLFDTSVLDVNIDLSAVINLLKTENDLRVLSQPRIFTHDNEQANFFDGQEIQIQSESQFTDTGTLNQSFEEKPVGIAFSVRPRITAERDVDLLVNLEISALNPATTSQGGIIFDRRQTQTKVIMKDRQTVIISGILRETESDIKRKIPLLGDIPLLGALFTSVDESNGVSEVVIFITPIVVDNPAENEGLNRPLREHLDFRMRPLDEQLKNPADTKRIWGEDLGRGIEYGDDEVAPSWIEETTNGSASETDSTDVEYTDMEGSAIGDE